jgi:hypothetical protein
VAADQANAQTRRAWLCFVDESGVKLTPPVRRTWAPRGQTPVLRHRYRRGRQLSMCGLVAYRPGQDNRDEPAIWMGFDLLEGADDTRQCIRVLDGLGHQLGHQRKRRSWFVGAVPSLYTGSDCLPAPPAKSMFPISSCSVT